MARRAQAAVVEVAQGLIGMAYEAAVEPARWTDFLDSFVAATGNQAAVIWLHDTSDRSAEFWSPDASFVQNVGIEDAYLKSYAEHYSHVNLLLDHIAEVPEGQVLCSFEMMPEAVLRRSEYYADWLRPQGTGYLVGGPLLRRGNVVAMFSTQRSIERGPFTAEQLRLLSLLMPHVRRACLLHQRVTYLEAQRTGAYAALDLLQDAVWLLDRAGKLVFANRAAQAMERRRDLVWIGADGRPRTPDDAQTRALARSIHDAIDAAAGRSVGGDAALLLRRSGAESTVHSMVYPLPASGPFSAAAAALFVLDSTRQSTSSVAALKTIYQLTEAEAQLAAALASGETIDDYAGHRKVSRNTVRTHLQRALSKMGVHRQSQLVGLVKQLPRVRVVDD